MGVKVACGRNVVQANDVPVLEEAKGSRRVVRRLLPAGKDGPAIVLILVVIASDLLLIRADRVRLHVRMQKTTSVTDILKGYPRAKGDLCMKYSIDDSWKIEHRTHREELKRSCYRPDLPGTMSSSGHHRVLNGSKSGNGS